jgi:tetratricopeptide (TPR) repeat protein
LKHKPNNWFIAIVFFIHLLVFSGQVHSDEINTHSQNAPTLELQSYLDHHWMVNRQLFEEYKTENSRIFLDKGKADILLGRYEQALQNFDRGLKIDPHHPLLLEEKERLILKMQDPKNKPPKALTDLTTFL